MLENTTEIFGLFSRFVFIGFILGFVYDIGRFIKFSLNLGKIFTFIHDFIFTFIFGIIIFIFSVKPGDGGIRLFYVFAALAGFTVYILSIGFLTKHIAKAFNRFFSMLFSAIKNAICILIEKISKTFYPKFNVLFVKIRQKKSDISEKCKNYLKKNIRMVYNDSKSKIGKLSENGGENRNVIKAKVKKSS